MLFPSHFLHFIHYNDIKNKRLNQQHQDTTRLIRDYGEFYIGDNSVARMKEKKGVIQMGKSLSDNSIGQFKTLLKYKGHRANRKVVLVSERFTSQACSNCGQRSGPKGLRQLVVRSWSCQDCNARHDRDINAARNMLGAQISTKNTSFQPRNGLPFATETSMLSVDRDVGAFVRQPQGASPERSAGAGTR